MTPSLNGLLPTLLFVPLIAFALYRRYKTHFGEQLVAPRRMVFRMVALCVVCAIVLATARTAAGLGAAAAGVALGVALARFAVARTRFESTARGVVYHPHPWVGLAITALFLGRLAARFWTAYHAAAHVRPGEAPNFNAYRSPFTTGVIFLMAGYYVVLYWSILRETRALGARAAIAAAAATPEPSRDAAA